MPGIVLKTSIYKESVMSPVLRIQQKTKYLPFGGLHLGQWGQVVKNSPASAGDTRDAGSIPGSGRSPGGGNGNPLQYSCLGNPKHRGAWWATVQRVAKSQTWLSNWALIHVQEGSGERGNKTTAGGKIIVQRRDRPQTKGINRHQNGAKGSSHVKQGCQGKRCGYRLSEQSPEELKEQPCISLWGSIPGGQKGKDTLTGGGGFFLWFRELQRGQCGWGGRGGADGVGGIMRTGMSQRLCNFLQTLAGFFFFFFWVREEKPLGALSKEETQPDLHF